MNSNADQPVSTGPPGNLTDGPGYEFDEVENLTIAKTANRAALWGYAAVSIGVLSAIALTIFALRFDELKGSLGPEMAEVPSAALMALIPIALINLIIGFVYIGAGKSLRKVVQTRGNDTELLCQGVEKMGIAFKIEVFVTIAAVLIAFVIGISTGVAV